MKDQEDIQRILALNELDIMYSLPEKMFDTITSLAAFICNTPIALITLLDDKNQFFKSHYGLDIDKTPIEQAFCLHAIKSDQDIFIVENATTDERFKDNPLVLSNPKIVFYAGVTLSNDYGIKLGTLCVIDTSKRALNKEQLNALKHLSNQVLNLLKLKENNKKLESYKLQLEDLNKRSSDFSLMASHDLKSPLNGIKSFLELIDNKNKSLWDDEDKQYLKFIFENVDRMNKLIFDLLAYSKSDINTINKEQVDLDELAKKVFRMEF